MSKDTGGPAFPQDFDEDGNPCCSQCGATGYINDGGGTACPSCRASILRECELDYADAMLSERAK